MSKNSRRSTCQRVSDGTDGAHPWRYRKVPAEQIALATSRAVHIRLLDAQNPAPYNTGGRDSAALAVYMGQHHAELDIEYFLTDTGKELPEVYEFLNRLEG